MVELVLKTLVVLVLSGFGGAYAAGWWRVRAAGHGRSCPGWRLGLYLAGLGAIGAALLSPIEELAIELFSAHMIQHLLLTMTAAPLLLLGNPLPVCLWGLPRLVRRAVARPLTRGRRFRRALSALTLLPVAWLLYVGDLWVWHLPVLYGFAIEHELAHAAEHAAFFLTALLFWWPIIEPAPRLHRRVGRGFKILYLVAATAQNTFLGMSLALPERVFYPQYLASAVRHGVDPLADQALAGGIMWSMGHMYLLPILLIFYTFAQDTARESGGSPA